MSPDDCKRVAELSKALNDSIDFYTEAAEQAVAKNNRVLFHRIASARARILEYLAPFAIHDYGEPHFYAFGSALQKVYPDMLRALEREPDPALVAISLQTEHTLGELLNETLPDIHSELLASVLRDLFPELNGCCTSAMYEKAS